MSDPLTLDPAKTALLLIEYQNEFTSEGGVLHGAVQGVMEKTGMDALDAYQFVSQNAVAPVTEMVDPLYTVLVKIPKSRLPR